MTKSVTMNWIDVIVWSWHGKWKWWLVIKSGMVLAWD